jgi:hypothetical protein
MTTYDSDQTVVMSREHLHATVSELDDLAKHVDAMRSPTHAPPPAPVMHVRSATPPPPPPASTHLARVMTVVGTVNKTADLLQLMAQLQIILSNRYYRARHALSALATKHNREVQTLLRRQSAETQALKHRHEESLRQLLDLHEQVEGEMRREIEQLTAALAMGPKVDDSRQRPAAVHA